MPVEAKRPTGENKEKKEEREREVTVGVEGHLTSQDLCGFAAQRSAFSGLLPARKGTAVRLSYGLDTASYAATQNHRKT